MWSRFHFKNMAERFLECVNAVYFNYSATMSTFGSEIVTIPFRFWLHYSLFSRRKLKTPQFMNETGGYASKLTRTYA